LKSNAGKAGQFIAQGPGPPQRPHIGESECDLVDSEPTAKTLMARAVCFEPHLGHAMPLAEVIDLISLSNFV
jgi:hypothetical protein